MPRKPRYFVPDVPVHAIVRGNDRRIVFSEDSDKEMYLKIMSEASIRFEVTIFAYVLMDNHVHLLMAAKTGNNISRFMQHLGRMYVPYFNAKYTKTGTLWEGRFKASLIEDEAYLLTCYRYIELNPVRAGMVNAPQLYFWSSYPVNALAAASELVKPHSIYNALGLDEEERASVYKSGFDEMVDFESINDIRNAVQTGTPLGSDRFKAQIENLLQVKVGFSKRGRPIKSKNWTIKGTAPFGVT